MSHYLAYEVIRHLYDEIKGNTPSSLNNVATFWANILPFYFQIDDGFVIQSVKNPAPQHCDGRVVYAIFTVKTHLNKVKLIKDKTNRLESSSSKWEKGLKRLTGHLELIRSDIDRWIRGMLYAALFIGTEARFYELDPANTQCEDYAGGKYGDEPLEYCRDEDTIHRILLDLIEKTKA